MYNKRRILVVAGSDSSGGAGLEADQKVIAAHGCYAMTATTALTAQNTKGVTDIHVIPGDFVAKQIKACVEDIGIDVLKTGNEILSTTLATQDYINEIHTITTLIRAESIKVVAQAIKNYSIPFSIIDPVMVATSGHRLVPEEAIQTLIDELLPVTTLLTPNIPEAILLLKKTGTDFGPVNGMSDMHRLAKALSALGPAHVLVKGGHNPVPRGHLSSDSYRHDPNDKIIINMLYSRETDSGGAFPCAYIASSNTHGTGCSLASAIASNIALGQPLEEAIETSVRYITSGIRHALPLGTGSGPISHFHSLQFLPFSPGSFLPYLFSLPKVHNAWSRFTRHSFVKALGRGDLPRQSYRYYMAQDYLYLLSFARANSLAGYKASSLESAAASAEIVLHIKRETELHVAECEALGIGREELEGGKEDLATSAYGRYILDVGMKGDWFGLQMALAPCLLGYGWIALGLARENGFRSEASSGGRKILEDLRFEVNGFRDEVPDDVNLDGEELSQERLERNRVERGRGNVYGTWIRNYTADDYLEAVRKGSELIEKFAAEQSPYRIKEIVDIFIHATDMETAFWDMGLRAGAN